MTLRPYYVVTLTIFVFTLSCSATDTSDPGASGGDSLTDLGDTAQVETAPADTGEASELVAPEADLGADSDSDLWSAESTEDAEPLPEESEVEVGDLSQPPESSLEIADEVAAEVETVLEPISETTEESVPETSIETSIETNIETIDPEELAPFTQCSDDAPCQAVFGPSSICNLSFPGGQCQGCDGAAGGDALCTTLGKGNTTLSCKETWPPVCLFDCPCPEWLRCAGGLCILKTCASDDDCGPLTCRPLSDGGTTYCMEP